MPYTRQERISLHKKQERTSIKSGAPSVSELREGVPVIRRVAGEGLVEFIRDGSVLYKKSLDAI